MQDEHEDFLRFYSKILTRNFRIETISTVSVSDTLGPKGTSTLDEVDTVMIGKVDREEISKGQVSAIVDSLLRRTIEQTIRLSVPSRHRYVASELRSLSKFK